MGNRSESCYWTSLLCCDLKPFLRVISPLESEKSLSGELKRIMIKLLRQNNSQSNEASIHIAHNLHKLSSCVFLRITSENVRPLTHFMKKYSSYIIYWITVGVFFQRNSFTREDAHSVLLFSLVSYSSSSCHATRHSFPKKNWRLPRLLSIFELLVK